MNVERAVFDQVMGFLPLCEFRRSVFLYDESWKRFAGKWEKFFPTPREV